MDPEGDFNITDFGDFGELHRDYDPEKDLRRNQRVRGQQTLAVRVSDTRRSKVTGTDQKTWSRASRRCLR